MRGDVQVEEAAGLAVSSARFHRLLDLVELRGLRLEEFDDLENLYP